MKQNLSTPQAYIRICTGVALAGMAISKLSNNPKDLVACMMLGIGSMNLADGILKWCPLEHLMEKKVRSIES
jgi:hypothetical protein